MTSSVLRPSPPATPAPGAAPHPLSTVRGDVATFLGLVTVMALSLALALPHSDVVVILTMPTPLLAVLLITFLRTPRGQRRRLWSTFGLRRLGLRTWPVAFAAVVVLVLAVPYGVADLLGSAALKPFSPSAEAWIGGSVNLVVTLAFITLMALTEEIGWRSFLLPRMQVLVSRRRAALLVGFIHGLFHMPLVLLTTTYNSVGSRWVVATTVMLLITAAGVFYAWILDRSGSVWPVAFAHSSVNSLLEGASLVTVVSPVALAYTAGESGVVTVICVVGLAAYLLVRGRCWDDDRAPAPEHAASAA